MATQVRVLTLEDGEDYQHVLYRVRKGWTIRFSLGTSLWYKKVEFFCNYPLCEENPFHRNKYDRYDWVKSDSSSGTIDDYFTEINIKRAGVYQFYIGIDDGERKTCCNGSFLVDPTLSRVKGELPLDSVIMHTVLCKLLGAFPEWKKQLALAYESGYNMLHFSPIQVLGESNSCYSIKDHHIVNPKFSTDTQTFDVDMMAHFVEKMHKSWGMFSIIDVVWNHAANDSEWLQKHCDAGYNLKNSPHMRPAFLVDRALWYLNKDIMNGNYVEKGLGQTISEEHELHTLSGLIRETLDQVRLKDFFVVDVFRLEEQFRNLLLASGFPDSGITCDGETLDGLSIIQDKEYTRTGCIVDMRHAVKACFKFWDSNLPHQQNMEKLCEHFSARLTQLNKDKEKSIQDLYQKIINNIIGHVRYHFIDPSGPKYKEVTELHSISVRYFSYPFEDTSYKKDCQLMDSDSCKSIMAHNGWVMGYDVTKNFADSESMVYLNRELVAWGDSIKLRYGNRPEDSPYLWKYMKTYTEQMARAFHGFRIDNCHSTPIHVAEYLLDCAREIRPDLYVLAELFTNNEATDNNFINRLGINSLIRENMGASNSRDLGRHVHRYGGEAVGSFLLPPVRPLRPSMAHAVFMDLTHDNRSLFDARTVFDTLPSSALVAATSCGIGSTRGYDELVPHHIHVVHESRHYQLYSTNNNGKGSVTKDHGIICAKDAFNELHTILSEQGYSQIYVDQMTEEVCSVTRHNPSTHESVILIAHNAFSKPCESAYPSMENKDKCHGYIPPVKIPGILEEVLLESRLLERKSSYVFEKDDRYINGSENYLLQMHEHFPIDKSKFCKMNHANNEVEFVEFVPGSVVAFKVTLQPEMAKSIQTLRHVLSMFPSLGCQNKAVSGGVKIAPFSDVVKNLSLIDLNRVLYRCDDEERSEGWGGGIYGIPGCGDMVYCGLQGLMSFLSTIHLNNDLGHPVCNNLREGNWLLDYTSGRLKHYQGTFAMGCWLEAVFAHIAVLPRYLVPCYFDAVITGVYTECLDRAFALMSSAVKNGSSFFKHLALGSLQMMGKSMDPMPPVVALEDESTIQYNNSMAAGLPHFSVAFMRCWGRDTFISLRGLLLLTGRFDMARNIILSFAGCVRHGLVPNLISNGLNARFNSRDATWFWLKAVQDYCCLSPEGHSFLTAPVIRMYPTDDSSGETKDQSKCELQDIIQEVLTKHFQGISFRERNAGPELDRDMSSDGFNQSAGVDMETGFVNGGSEHNCGTWMDKMGSSAISGNAGHPATPRDGSAVEIVGLCKSALQWLIGVHAKGEYRYGDVSRTDEQGKSIVWSYETWNKKIQCNFESKFFVSKDSTEHMVHKREIYKDTHLSHGGFTDYQLRPNFPIAMCVAPELFVPEHAMAALSMVEKHLLGPIGLKTLDPDDWKYDGFYENHVDSDNFHKAKGFNYHQGPEWTWVLGPFLRAKLYFSQLTQSSEEFRKTVVHVKKLLMPHYRLLMSSQWRGLPELTNKDGAHCQDSCPTQAWSMACLLEVLHYIEQCQSV